MNEPIIEIGNDFPITVLPVGMDRSNLKDVTEVGAVFRRFINTETGEIVDGEDYATLIELP